MALTLTAFGTTWEVIVIMTTFVDELRQLRPTSLRCPLHTGLYAYALMQL